MGTCPGMHRARHRAPPAAGLGEPETGPLKAWSWVAREPPGPRSTLSRLHPGTADPRARRSKGKSLPSSTQLGHLRVTQLLQVM